MENRGWGNSPTLDSGPVFTCIVTGDPRLPEVAYPFVRDTLDQLLATHLSTVRIVYVWRTAGADHLAGRYARERTLDINFVNSRKPEVLAEVSADAVVVFDGGGKESAELVRWARVALPGKEGTVRGFSEVALLVVDEAARVLDTLYCAIRPMLAISRGRLVALSTPWGKRGWFHDEWHSAREWERVRITALECPRISAEFLAEEREALGENFYAQEYLCEIP